MSERDERVERAARQANANAFALDALAAFARFRTSLPVDMPFAERTAKIEEWADRAMTVVGEQIDELEAYEREDMEYTNRTMEFLINMTQLAFVELRKVLPRRNVERMLAEAVERNVLEGAIKLQDDLNIEFPEFPENQF